MNEQERIELYGEYIHKGLGMVIKALFEEAEAKPDGKTVVLEDGTVLVGTDDYSVV